jgi:hypothetical protein
MARADTLNALRAVATSAALAPLPPLIGQHLDPQVVRPAHIREVFAAADGVAVLRHQDVEMVVLTKHIKVSKPFCWVVTANRVQEQWMVAQALRLYGDEGDLARWAKESIEAFAEALERWGIDFESKVRPVRFLPFRQVQAAPQNTKAIVSALGITPEHSFTMTQMLKVSGDTTLAWVYFIDQAAYAAALRAQ